MSTVPLLENMKRLTECGAPIMATISVIAVGNCTAGITRIDHLCIVSTAGLPRGHHRGCIRRTHGTNLRGGHAVVAEIIHQLTASCCSNVAQAIIPRQCAQTRRCTNAIDQIQCTAISVNGPITMPFTSSRCGTGTGSSIAASGRASSGTRGGPGACRRSRSGSSAGQAPRRQRCRIRWWL